MNCEVGMVAHKDASLLGYKLSTLNDNPTKERFAKKRPILAEIFRLNSLNNTSDLNSRKAVDEDE